MLRFAGSTEYFPLACSAELRAEALTLSLPPSRRAKAPLRRDGGGEREQQASDWYLANGRWANAGTGVIEGRWTILPLPKLLFTTSPLAGHRGLLA
jgi:hypothetical protein